MYLRTFTPVMLAAFCLLALSACQMGGRTASGRSSITDAVTNRTIERERLHSAEEIAAEYDRLGSDSDEVLLLFMNAVLLAEDDKDEANYAIAYLSRANDQWEDADSPTGVRLSKIGEEYLRRVADEPGIARSYVGGTGDGFSMSDPETISIEIKETRDEPNGDVKYFIWSTGKDNASPIRLREGNGKWYVDEWSSIQTGVR